MAEKTPKYEAPVVIDLGNLAKGAGAVCSKGKGQVVCSKGTKAGGASPSVCAKGSHASGACAAGKHAGGQVPSPPLPPPHP